MNVEFKFAMDEKVFIVGLKCAGEVRGLWIDESSVKHVLVRYFGGGQVKDAWMREPDLLELDKKTKGGSE